MRNIILRQIVIYTVGCSSTLDITISPYPTWRYYSLRKKVKTIIQTAIVTVILCGIWQMLEYLIYGEVQPRIVDDIMMLLFIPFIYIRARD